MFHFHSNLSFNLALVGSFPEFCKQIFINWSNYFVSNFEVPSCIQSNFLWYNKYTLIDNKPVYISSFSDKNVNLINNLLDCLGNLKSWNVLKTEFKLADSLYFSWMQLINAVPLNWKTVIKHNCSRANLFLLNYHLIKKDNLINLDKLHSRELYNILVYTSPHKPTSQVYFKNLFRKQEWNWKEIYIRPRKVSLDCKVKSFQCKVLNNVFIETKKLFIFGKTPSFVCLFCKQADETIHHLFYEYNITKDLWNRLDLFFNDCFHPPQPLPQTAFFGFFNTYTNNDILEIIFFYFLKFICTISESKEKLH